MLALLVNLESESKIIELSQQNKTLKDY